MSVGLIGLLISASICVAQADPYSGGLVEVAAVSNQQAATGIKQALSNGTAEAVSMLGKPGGYFNNSAIKITLPSQLKPLETGLRAIGYGPQLDKFVLSMNQAAEAAAPKAEPIFEQAIKTMTVTDAERIVTGGGTSATDYFKRKTTSQLTAAFTPIVSRTMDEYSVTRQYDQLSGKSHSGLLGAVSSFGGASQPFNLNSYVVHKSLDGLFYMIGQKERKIRTDPAAQVTPLLRTVFGGH
ncbi:MAG: DUF4197 domain-containing protein [Candidatus Binataceae bacterium]